MLDKKEEIFIKKLKNSQKIMLILIPLTLILSVLWIYYVHNVFANKIGTFVRAEEIQKKITKLEPSTELEVKLRDVVSNNLEFDKFVGKLFKIGITSFISLSLFALSGIFLLLYLEYKKILIIIEKLKDQKI